MDNELTERLEERDFLGQAMNMIEDVQERMDLFDRLCEIEQELFDDYAIYPVYTGWGWRPPTPQTYKRKPRKPIRQKFSPVLSPVLESPRRKKRSKATRKKRSKRSRKN